ncbi:hypothetical protein J4221_04735 [Candidatus Pacearchaeota archaeon]|nr:hypothetical protein [Candidatus Pacearchaeota archaeon]
MDSNLQSKLTEKDIVYTTSDLADDASRIGISIIGQTECILKTKQLLLRRINLAEVCYIGWFPRGIYTIDLELFATIQLDQNRNPYIKCTDIARERLVENREF